jgi:signal transduction histidine kinase
VRRKFPWFVLGLGSLAYVPLAIWGLATLEDVSLAAVVWVAGLVPAMIGAGVLLMIKRPENPIGELTLWSGLTTFLIPTIPEIPTMIIHAGSGPQEWMWAGMWLAMTSGVLGFVLIMALVVTMPNGKLQYPRERRFIALSSVVVLFPTLSLFTNEFVYTHPEAFIGIDDVPSPVFVEALEPIGATVNLMGNLVYALFVWAVVLQVLRYRRAPERQRRQVRWVLFGGVGAILLGVAPSLLDSLGVIDPIVHGSLASFIVVPAFLLFMGSIITAVLEPAWADIDIVIRKSFVYGALSFLILLLYVGAASAFGLAAGARLQIELAVVLTVVVALMFQPARRRLQTVADRWVFGVRPTKYEAVTEFGETIEQAVDPDELLSQLVETLRRALRLNWARAELDDGSNAIAGEPGEAAPVFMVPIRAGNEDFGMIECGRREDGELESDEKQLVRTLAGQVGLAVMNARLAGRIVTAAESERRRIERNIHDGAQQELVALVARLGMARAAAGEGRLSPGDLQKLQREAGQILEDLRELAQGIHPSVLSDGGILEAIEERCSRLPLKVSITAPGELHSVRYDDDIEGAAYFFVTEALANVLKHAEAKRVAISMSPSEDELQIAVVDDGHGFDTATTSLNGLAGLTDRVRALGGTVMISSRSGGGTRLEATLPVNR